MPIQLHTPYSSEHAKVPVGSITMGLPLTMDPKKLGKKSGGEGCLARKCRGCRCDPRMTAVVFGESRDRELNICSVGKGQLRQGHFPAYKSPLANNVMEGRKHIATPQAGGIKSK